MGSTRRITLGSKKKIAFVCSGGGTKAGAFHLGVALALQEQGFKFLGGLAPKGTPPPTPGPMEIATYVGSSAGSIISTYLAAGYSLENIFNSFLSRPATDSRDATPRALPRLSYQVLFHLRRDILRDQIKHFSELRKFLGMLLKRDWDSLIELKWFHTGAFFSTRGIEKFLRQEVLLSNQFDDYFAELFITATQLNHSRKVVFGKYHYLPPPDDPNCQYSNNVPISEACAASAALPFVYTPYKIKTSDGKTYHYVDGEIRDTLSTHVAVDAGADLLISSYTHQPYHYSRAVGSLTKLGLPSILIQSIYLVIEQKINAHIHNKKIQHNAIEAVQSYCKQQGISDEQRRRICEILETELHHNSNVDTIYIHPRPSDHAMFTREHFSLQPKTLSEIVKSGFKAGIDTLRHYDFADRKTG